MDENDEINALIRTGNATYSPPLELSPEEIARVNADLAAMNGVVDLSPKPLPRKKWKAKEFKGNLTDLQVGYKVQKGDTLWNISKKTGISVDELLAANGLKKGSQLRAGVTLNIPERYQVPKGPVDSVLRVEGNKQPPALAPTDTKHSLTQWDGKSRDTRQQTLQNMERAIVAPVAAAAVPPIIRGTYALGDRLLDKTVDDITAVNEGFKARRVAEEAKALRARQLGDDLSNGQGLTRAGDYSPLLPAQRRVQSQADVLPASHATTISRHPDRAWNSSSTMQNSPLTLEQIFSMYGR